MSSLSRGWELLSRVCCLLAERGLGTQSYPNREAVGTHFSVPWSRAGGSGRATGVNGSQEPWGGLQLATG